MRFLDFRIIYNSNSVIIIFLFRVMTSQTSLNGTKVAAVCWFIFSRQPISSSAPHIHTAPLNFLHSRINPPWGFQYPGHLPGQPHYLWDLWGRDCEPPHSTGPLSFMHGGFPAGRLCTQQARHHGKGPAQGLIRTTCPCGSSPISNISFPSWGRRK